MKKEKLEELLKYNSEKLVQDLKEKNFLVADTKKGSFVFFRKNDYKTVYKPEFCQMLIDHMGQGFLYEAFAGKVGVSIEALYNWEKLYPEWKHAKALAIAKALAHDEELLEKGIKGEPLFYIDEDGKKHKTKINPMLLIFRLKNRYPNFYSDVNKIDVYMQTKTEQLVKKEVEVMKIVLEKTEEIKKQLQK